MGIEILYFGCINEAGHYLFSKTRPRIRIHDQPWGNDIDGKAVGHGGYGRQGLCVTTKKDGWTAVDFTDNSVDTRPGSHSCFLCHSDISTEEVLRLAREQWPEVFGRKRFPDLSYQPAPKLDGLGFVEGAQGILDPFP